MYECLFKRQFILHWDAVNITYTVGHEVLAALEILVVLNTDPLPLYYDTFLMAPKTWFSFYGSPNLKYWYQTW